MRIGMNSTRLNKRKKVYLPVEFSVWDRFTDFDDRQSIDHTVIVAFLP